jgi:hypothetical protein
MREREIERNVMLPGTQHQIERDTCEGRGTADAERSETMEGKIKGGRT